EHGACSVGRRVQSVKRPGGGMLAWLVRIYPALSVARFRLAWAGMLPSQAAVNMGEVATPYAAFVLTGSGTAIGVVPLIGGLPMLLFTLVGGVVADRVPRYTVLIGAQTV